MIWESVQGPQTLSCEVNQFRKGIKGEAEGVGTDDCFIAIDIQLRASLSPCS